MYISILSLVAEISKAKYNILMNTVSKIKPLIFYILGDMIPSTYGSSLFQNSSLNGTPGENYYIFIYRGPNGIPEAVPEREQNLISVV